MYPQSNLWITDPTQPQIPFQVDVCADRERYELSQCRNREPPGRITTAASAASDGFSPHSIYLNHLIDLFIDQAVRTPLSLTERAGGFSEKA